MGGRFRKRLRADWVYRSNAQSAEDQDEIADVLGTYEPLIFTHSTGVGNSLAHILYDSQQWGALQGGGGVALGGWTRAINRAARAEGRKATILAVEGIIYWEPSVWALGNLMAIGVRLGCFEQDPGTGNILLDAAYSMWTNEVGGSSSRPSGWANPGRGNTWERRYHVGFSETVPFFVSRIAWRGRRVLQPNECFAVYTELENTSVNTRTQMWLRTLVSDES